jgi:SAM-dependent methyltransferase
MSRSQRRLFWNANTHYHHILLDALPPKASRVLDVGCGDGILLADLVGAGIPHVIGIDVDHGVLDRARAQNVLT